MEEASFIHLLRRFYGSNVDFKGVFLIIYFISMLFCGIPIFLLEVSLGQYLGAGGMTTTGQLVPILKGWLHF